MRMVLLRHINQSKLLLPSKSNNMHAFCYLPDWARAAVLLTETRNTLAQFEDIPFGGYTFTLKELQIELEHALGCATRLRHRQM